MAACAGLLLLQVAPPAVTPTPPLHYNLKRPDAPKQSDIGIAVSTAVSAARSLAP